MTKQNAKNNNTKEIINGQEVRGALVNKRKFYFVSDLVKLYGSSFLSKLLTTPIMVRLTVDGNSQSRRLVNVMEFKTAIKAGNKNTSAPAKVSKKVIAEQLELPLSKTVSSTKKDSTVKHKEHKPADTEVNDFHTARMNMLKSDIIHWCGVAGAKEARARNLTKEELKESNNEIRRQVYYTVYQEFDRVLAAQMGIKQYQLGEHKLGKKFRLEGRYMEAVEKAGHLELLHSVTKQMFSK